MLCASLAWGVLVDRLLAARCLSLKAVRRISTGVGERLFSPLLWVCDLSEIVWINRSIEGVMELGKKVFRIYIKLM